ncbi:MAG: LacI family DNA-binding transcriptional regulator [Rhizobium sp.]|nr:LacI family DNA-binding transcriptional regulator [Rhizobium sp.]
MPMTSSKRVRTTIHDVAHAAGVSISTVSKALNDTGRMRPETRERIRKIADELQFRPNALARSLLGKRSFSIGLLTNDTYGRFSLPMMSGVSEALVDHGVSVFLCATNDDQELTRRHIDALLDKQVDGIIFSATRLDRRPPIDLSRLSVPVVYAFAEGPKGSVALLPDDDQGARLAVEHLIARGRRHIAHVTGPSDFRAARYRAEAYRRICGDAEPVLFGYWTEEWGHEAVKQLWSRDAPPPDGLFCGNDQIARGVIDALRDRNVSIPDDVSVVGFDNWDVVAEQTRPSLTTIDMELKELGRQAGLAILALSKGQTFSGGVRKLPCSIVVRRSS